MSVVDKRGQSGIFQRQLPVLHQVNPNPFNALVPGRCRLELKKSKRIAKKAGIYSRLLTDMALAEDMEALAVRCGERKKTLEGLAGGGK